MSKQDEKVQEKLFQGLVKSFKSNAEIQLGMKENPLTGENEQNLDQAKYSINMLEMLQEKTEGNVAEREKKYLDKVASRMKKKYVEKKMDDE